jgi:hypothetical protein
MSSGVLRKVLLGVIIISLLGSMTNLIYLSASASLFSIFLLPHITFEKPFQHAKMPAVFMDVYNIFIV